MRNVKIKKAPRTGDQKDYALVFNDKAQSTTNTAKPKVGTTMRATNNGNESVEVEGGETVVGDINYDGLLELMSFEGKRHSEGGMNVHIPDGSFIFSDTPALRIKDKEILDMFGMSGKKKHYTPAEISKKFQVNEYIDILKDDNADDISKRTANEMLKKNTEKLAMLAVVQESIKGLPNGIPDFAQNVLAGLQQQEMKMGGELPKAQQGGEEDYGFMTPIMSYIKDNFEKPSVDNLSWTSLAGLALGPAAPVIAAMDLVYQRPESNIDYIPSNTYKSKISPDITAPTKSQSNTTQSNTNQSYATPDGKVFKTKEEFDAYIKSLEPTKTNTSTKSSKTNETYNTVKVTDYNWNDGFEKNKNGGLKMKEGGEFPKYQNGSEVTSEKKINKGEVKQDNTGRNVYKYEVDGIKYVEDAETGKILLENNNGYIKDYTQEGQVIHKTKKGNTFVIPAVGSDFALDSYEGVYNKDIQTFNNLLDSNPEIQKAIYEKYRTNPGADKSLSQPQVIALLKKGNYDNAIVQSVFKDNAFLKDESWDRLYGEDKNVVYNQTLKELGINPMQGPEIKAFQAAFQAATDIALDDKWKPIFKNNGFDINPVGVYDETYRGKNVSPVDDYYGNTTVGQMFRLAQQPKQEEVKVNTNSTVNVTDNKKVNVDTTTPDLADPFPKDTPRPIDTWFAPDITNFVGSLTDKINRYEPAMSKLDFVNPDYVLLDPTRQLAANQEQMARFSNQLENSVDPQIALATMLGASGQGFQNAANVLGNVENANVQITNQALNNSAQIENQEIGVNEAARQSYISQMATLNENEDRARNLKKWRVINAYNQGWHNYNKDQMMEQVLFPQVHTDNITGDVSVIPGRDITVPNTYSNHMNSGSMGVSNEFFEDLWTKVPGNTSQEKLDYIKAYSMYANPKLAAFSANDYQNYMMQKFGGFINNKK